MTKIFMAGGEAWWERFRDHGIRFCLFSFHYLRTKRDFSEMVEWMMKARRDGYIDPQTGQKHQYMFFLDSGGFTFKKKGDPHGTLDDYSEEFIRFVTSDPAAAAFDIIAEMDVAIDITNSLGEVRISGYDRMLRWRRHLYDGVGDRLMPVYGSDVPIEFFHEWGADPRYRYFGLASNFAGDLPGQRRNMTYLHQQGKWVHAFGMTRLQTDMKYLTGYESVDSTTWLRSDKFGGTFIIRKGNIVVLDHHQKEQRKHYRRYFERIGCDPDKILGLHVPHDVRCSGPDSLTPNCGACQDQMFELRKSALVAWRNLTYYFERFDNRGIVRSSQLHEMDSRAILPGSTSNPIAARASQRFRRRTQ